MSLAIELVGDVSGPDTVADPEKLAQAYQAGVRNALLSVGLAFGLEPVGPSIQRKPSVTPGLAGLAGLLWAEIPHER